MPRELDALGSGAGAVLAVGLLALAGCGLGGLVVKFTRPGRWTIGETLLVRIIFGLNLLALLGVILGQLGLLTQGRTGWLLAAGSLVAVVDFARTRGDWLPPAGSWRQRFNGRPSLSAALVGGLALLATLATLGPALCFPAGWDELVYHATLPRRWAAEGWPAFYADLPYSGFPSLGEILFWLASPIESLVTSRLLVWAAWMAGFVLLEALLRRRLPRQVSLALVLALAISPASLLVSANCYVEALLMADLAAMLFVLAVPQRAASDRVTLRTAAILGILAGGAAAVKLTGVVLLVVPLGVLAALALKPSRRTRALAASATATTVAALVALPFYLRPWLATGNPLYPYFAGWFSDDPARLEMSRYHHAIGGAWFGVHTLDAFLTGPILLAFRDENYDGWFGWQLVGLLALAGGALVVRRRRALWAAAVLVGLLWLALYAFWFFTAQQARFLVPAMLLVVLLAGQGFRQLVRQQGPWRSGIVAALVLASLASLPWRTAGYYAASWLTIGGAFSQTHFVDEGTSFRHLPLARACREHLPENARLLVLFENRTLYLPQPALVGTPFFQERGFTPPEDFAEPAAILARLREDQITHVVLAKGPLGPDRLAEWTDRLDPLFRSLEAATRQDALRVIWESDDYALLEVRATRP
jgi:hypothetical protein